MRHVHAQEVQGAGAEAGHVYVSSAVSDGDRPCYLFWRWRVYIVDIFIQADSVLLSQTYVELGTAAVALGLR